MGAIEPAPRHGSSRSVLVAADWPALAAIRDPDVCAVLMPRRGRALSRARLAQAVRRVSGGWPQRSFDAEQLPPDALGAALRQRVAEDEARLGQALRDVCGPVEVQRELLVVVGQECRKFHVDHYRARALVTYVGRGTEVVPSEAVDRAALATGGDDIEAANRNIVPALESVVHARAFDVVLLKGATFARGPAAVHRSSPDAGPDRPRLLLKLTVR